MAVSTVPLLLFILLAISVKQVCCPIASSASHSEDISPSVKDPCDNHQLYATLLHHMRRKQLSVRPPLCRSSYSLCQRGLRRNNHSELDTMFWWYLILGCASYFTWMFYFLDCGHPRFSVFPIYVACILGGVIHLILLSLASWFTRGDRDKRGWVMAVVLLVSMLAGFGLWFFGIGGIGWLGLTLTALSHCFRAGATMFQTGLSLNTPAGVYHILILRTNLLTNYRDKFKVWLFGRFIPIWLINAMVSVVGSINGFLWLTDPQLCMSREYKISSYVTGVVRGLEAFLWCSHALAWGLSRFEGKPVDDGEAVEEIELELM
ncbi:hypothetical protein ACP4OV_023523 [Aristida adscensionis]